MEEFKRVAYELNVICKENAIERLEVIIFQNTTTIGIRRARMERTIMSRELQRIDTPLGEAQVNAGCAAKPHLHGLPPEPAL